MKYDKMVECSLERSKQKVETAKREIQEMLESKEKITVAALIQKTGFSKGFFYRNEEMRRVVNEAMHQQSVTYNPKQNYTGIETKNKKIGKRKCRVARRIGKGKKNI